jgi:hypothetical protein
VCWLAAINEAPTPGSEFYILPQIYLNNFKALATGTSKDVTLTQAALHSLDLTSLVDDDREFEDVHMWIPTPEAQMDPDIKGIKGQGRVERRTVHNIKDGLQEGEDYGFISKAGWEKLVEWYAVCCDGTID